MSGKEFLKWESVCHESKAIAAVITDENGEIISVGRNKVGESEIPNPRVSRAETEAVRDLDIRKYPDLRSYTLYAALEPCPMCMGTLVMGGIRKVVIGAKKLFEEGLFTDKAPGRYTAEFIFDELCKHILSDNDQR